MAGVYLCNQDGYFTSSCIMRMAGIALWLRSHAGYAAIFPLFHDAVAIGDIS